MFEVRVNTDFAAAHFLRDYHGKCENLHGHNYEVYAHVRGTETDEGGMLMDFSVLKDTLRTVCGRLDHKNLNDFDVFKQNPSAERVAKFIFDAIVEEIPALKKSGESGAFLYAVDVFETKSSRARYFVD